MTNLRPDHRDILERESKIQSSIIESRGYYTALTKAELREIGFPASQQLAPALVVPLFNPDGTKAGYQIRPDSPRLILGRKKPNKYETPNGQQNILDVHPEAVPLLRDPNIPLIITEGVKKGDAMFGAWGKPVVTLSGVDNWRGKNELGGLMALAAWNDIPLKGRTVYIAFDSDISENIDVKRAAEKLAAYLKSKGATVKYFAFPSTNGKKVGGDDYVAANGPFLPLVQFATEHPPGWAPTERSPSGRAAIVVNNRPLDQITADAIEAVAGQSPAVCYVRDGALAYVYEGDDGVSIRNYTRWSLQRALGEVADWILIQGDDKPPRQVSPPLDVCDAFIYQSKRPKGIHSLQGIAPAPIVTPKGIVTKYGYDESTGWFLSSRECAVPFDGDATAAAEWLMLEILGDFPFSDEPSRTHALSMILLPFFRAAIDGPTPLYFVDAPQSGTGKSMLVEACLRPGIGSGLGTTSLQKSDEQFEKTLDGLLVNGSPVIWLDNLGRYLANDKLEAAITAEQVFIRRMGSDTISTIRPKCIWALTSNNGKIKEDFLRRSAYIRLNAKTENPSLRTGFRHENLISWVKSNRYKIWGAVLKIADQWIASGSPRAPIKGNGSFVEWSAVMGGVLAMVGRDDLMQNAQTMAQNVGVTGEDVSELAAAAIERFGRGPYLVKELLEIAIEKEILLNVTGEGSPRAQSTRLGTWLGKRHEMVSGGFLVERSTTLRGMARFNLTPVVDLGGPISTELRARGDGDSGDKTLFNGGDTPIGRLGEVHQGPPSGDFEPKSVVDLAKGPPPTKPADDEGILI